jgi:hypothetical protein
MPSTPPLLNLGIGRRKRARQRQPADVVQQPDREGQVGIVPQQFAGQPLRTQGTGDRVAPEGVVVEAGVALEAARQARGRDNTAHRAQAQHADGLGHRAHLPAAPVERGVGQAQCLGGQGLVARDLGRVLRGAEFLVAERLNQFEHHRRQRGQVAQRGEQFVAGDRPQGCAHEGDSWR